MFEKQIGEKINLKFRGYFPFYGDSGFFFSTSWLFSCSSPIYIIFFWFSPKLSIGRERQLSHTVGVSLFNNGIQILFCHENDDEFVGGEEHPRAGSPSPEIIPTHPSPFPEKLVSIFSFSIVLLENYFIL